ncbi:MAG TPA: hypothetical protein VG778_03590 [Blastocatellia bacterium]|jgi:hypothetical protein|nr:hypothetical protein [Blastocatellia bacterium]
MKRIARALKIALLVQVGTFFFLLVTAPFLGSLGLLAMPGILFILPEPDTAANRALFFWLGIAADILFYATVVYGFTWWAERRRVSTNPPSIV